MNANHPTLNQRLSKMSDHFQRLMSCLLLPSQKVRRSFVFDLLPILLISLITSHTQQTFPSEAQGQHSEIKSWPQIHDPSTIIRCKDTYWVFGTGFGIKSYKSQDLATWIPGLPVFKAPPAWTTNLIPGNRGHFWAPDIIYLNGKYLLYYSVSIFGKNTSAIGLASNKTLDPNDPEYCWEDRGPVISSTSKDNYNAIDPAVLLDEHQRLWLVFGSFWSGIKMIELSPETGLRICSNSPIYSLAWHPAIEAPYIYRRGDWYYLFVNWDACCRGALSTYNIRVGRSREITGPYVDAHGQPMLNRGGTLLLGSMNDLVGPGHVAILNEPGGEYLSIHFYDRTKEGRPTLAVFKLEWDANGWPFLSTENRLW